MNDEVKVAVLETRLDAMDKKLDEIVQKLDTNFVTQAVWDERNKLVDSRLENLEKSKAPWWTWATTVGLVLSLAWSFLQPMVQHLLSK